MADDFTPLGVKDDFTPAPKAPEPKTKPGEKYGPAREQSSGNAVTDTLGLSGRQGARTPVGVVLRPQNVGELMTREAVLAPLTAASLPVRIGAQAGLGAVERLTDGKGLGAAGWGALIDGAVAGLTEAVLGKVGGKIAEHAKPLRAFESAKTALGEALDAISARLPKGKWMRVPSISGGKMTADEAVQELAKLRGAEYKQAREEIANELSRLDAQRITGPKPVAGTVFKQRTSPDLFEPGKERSRRAAGAVSDAVNSRPARAIADTAATTPIDDSTGVPIGAVPIMGAIERGGDAWHWLKNAALHR